MENDSIQSFVPYIPPELNIGDYLLGASAWLALVSFMCATFKLLIGKHSIIGSALLGGSYLLMSIILVLESIGNPHIGPGGMVFLIVLVGLAIVLPVCAALLGLGAGTVEDRPSEWEEDKEKKRNDCRKDYSRDSIQQSYHILPDEPPMGSIPHPRLPSSHGSAPKQFRRRERS